MAPPQLYKPVWSEWVIAETWRVLTWRWARRGLGRDELATSANAMLHRLLRVMTVVSLQGQLDGGVSAPIADPNDVPIWTTAVLSRARYMVSDDVRDFPPLVEERAAVDGRDYLLLRHHYQGIEYLTASEFIHDVLGQQAEEVLGRAPPHAGMVRSLRATRLL